VRPPDAVRGGLDVRRFEVVSRLREDVDYAFKLAGMSADEIDAEVDRRVSLSSRDQEAARKQFTHRVPLLAVLART
jgi:hypothetical protein